MKKNTLNTPEDGQVVLAAFDLSNYTIASDGEKNEKCVVITAHISNGNWYPSTIDWLWENVCWLDWEPLPMPLWWVDLSSFGEK